MPNDFKNRFPALRKWEDRITDACIFDDWHPGADRDTPKYDIFLAHGWSWRDVTNGADCQRTETFRTLAEAKTGLRAAVNMLQDRPAVCRACPHYRDGDCHA